MQNVSKKENTFMGTKPKIKILYLITGLHVGGAEVLLRDINRKINKNSFDIKILSLTPIGSIGEEIIHEGGDVSTLSTKFKFSPLILFGLLRVLFQYKPDIVHAHLFHADFLGRIASLIYRKPRFVSTMHNIDMGGVKREILLRLTRFIPIVQIAVAESINNKMIQYHISSAEKTITIYNSIDLEYYSSGDKDEYRKKLGINQSALVFVSVGRLVVQKGYGYLVESLATVLKKTPHFRMYVLGEGTSRAEIQRAIDEQGLADNIKLVGNTDNVREFLRAADLFVMSSLWEGLPVSLLEAMACGVPVVSTRVGGVSEVVENGIVGFLAEPKNPQNLAKKILQISFMSEEKRNKMGRCGRRIVEKKFSLVRMVKKHETLYENLVSYYKV